MPISQRISKFYGLNNMLNPSSAEYKEGMAYKSANARLDEHGLWTAQQVLVGISDAPPIQPSPHGTAGYFKVLAVDDVAKIVTLGLNTRCDVGPNKKLYSTDGSGAVKNAAGDITNLTRPSISVATGDGTGTRGQNGTYYYVCTIYNTTYDREGLPSATADSDEIDHADGDKDRIVLTSGETATETNKIRFYRSKRTSAADGIYNPANIFYFLGEITSGTTYTDYLHDSEIANAEYEGRGTAPPSGIDCLVSFNNRMLYFKKNVLYWSSAGRPEEVAQEYSITIGGSTITCKPKLGIGVYGEAKYEIAELSGHKVVAALPIGGRLYVWSSNNVMGYLEPTNRLEGYRFYTLYEGIGVTSDKVLALTPYGLFGADRQGIWRFTGRTTPDRLTDKTINLYTGDGTTFSSSNFTNSFGVWVPRLNEYWWGVSGKIIAYQADRNMFVGPYNYSVSGGCALATASGAHAYLTGAVTPSPTIKANIGQTLEFWFGQSAPKIIKDQVVVEIVHSVVPGSSVTAKVYQNCIASTIGATDSGNITYSTSIGEVRSADSGRFFMLRLTLPSAGAPVAVVGYEYNPVNLE